MYNNKFRKQSPRVLIARVLLMAIALFAVIQAMTRLKNDPSATGFTELLGASPSTSESKPVDNH